MRKYFVFVLAALPMLLASISTYSSSVALPVIVSDFNTTLVTAGWILTVYSLIQTIVMPLAGRISDTLGRRLTFIICVSLFLVGSVLCAIAPNIYILIGARVIQALGGGGFMPTASGIISDEFPEQRQRFIGLLASFMPIGMIIGPNLGGWMVEAFGWRSTFWLNVPLSISVIALTLILLPKEERKIGRANIDYTASGLLFAAIFSFMFGITQLGQAQSDVTRWVSGVFLPLGIVLAVLFYRRQVNSQQPILDVQLLKERRFLASNVYNFLYGLCFIGVRTLIPLYMVSIYGMSTLESGAILTPWSIGMIATSTITSFSLMKWGYRKPMLIGTTILALGFTALALEPQSFNIGGLHLGHMPILLVIMGFMGIGHGICTPAANNACIELLPEKISTITGLRGMFRQLGGAIGVAIATVVLHMIPDIHGAFLVVMLATALIAISALPNVFVMPELKSETK